MRRREFIALLGGVAAARVISPHGALAQPRAPVIGFLDPKSAAASVRYVAAFREGLKAGGYVEGGNVAIEFRWAEGQNDQLPMMAADLVRRQVAVIAAISPSAALAAKSATTTIPIVFQTGSDPVELGLVSSLNRPGGNLTGISRLATELTPKLLEALHEAAPMADNVAFLMNPASVNAEEKTQEAQLAAHTLGLKQFQVLNAATKAEIDAAFVTLSQKRANALLIGQDVFFNNQVEQLADLALRHAVPAVYSLREFAVAGGLMSYGASLADQYQLVGIYVGRILNGEKPADLPVQQAMKVEMTVNLKTAKALGLTLPLTLLGRADEVIE
jgi:putative tryptophan/tyrosine transport system substrate-binding protein